MTLIATKVSRFGIVQASDSNLTAGNQPAGAGKKVFDLPFGRGALAVAGTYSVGSVEMDRWMSACISTYSAGSNSSLGAFAEHLRERLNRELTHDEREDFTMVQIGGYVEQGDGSAHPAMFFVTNVEGLNDDGSYREPAMDDCKLSEDFWDRDYKVAGTKVAVATGGWQSYFNGFPEGRIAYTALVSALNEFFAFARSVTSWRFRTPQSLEEVGALTELEFRAMDVMFQVSDYPARYIGGAPQVHLIAPPSNVVEL